MVNYDQGTITAMWISIALLTAGYARTRNRSAWGWFFLALVFGPIAVFFVVVLPKVEFRRD
jgi:hypothetical protein